MKDVIFLLFHLLSAIARLIQPSGSRAVIAENLLLKQQLIIHSRSRQRAPNLTTRDCTLLGFLSLFLNSRRMIRSAIVIKPSTLRVLDIVEIKSLPHVPMSHPFLERLIGRVRQELLDQTFFWRATDLEHKLRDYQYYYNEYRAHSGRGGVTPVEKINRKVADINKYRWEKHCRGIFELPIAA